VSTVPTLERRRVPVDLISPAAYNPRIKLRPDSPKYQELRASLLEFGEAGGIVWNEETGNLVGGHQRYWIMVDEFGATEIEVVVVNLDEQRERVLNLRLNKPASDWDAELLPEAYARISEELRWLTGFQDQEINDIVRAAEVESPDAFLNDLASSEPNTAVGVGGAELKDDHPHRTGEQYYQFQLVLDADQRAVFFEAVARAKSELDLVNTMDAIVAVCARYLD
jgi:hypothetical protein